ncbi:MAG: hypothetical protein ACKVU0_02160 [Saprospiraceae bacterium]
MKNKIKICFLFTFLAFVIGCYDPLVPPVAKVENAWISKLEEPNNPCFPKPGCVRACVNGLASYKVFYTLSNISNDTITVSNPQLNKKLGSATTINRCPGTANQLYPIRPGESIILTDSLCFSGNYTFLPNQDSVIFSFTLQGSQALLKVTLPVCN